MTQTKLSALDRIAPEDREKILDFARENGIYKASRKYALELDTEPQALYMKLRKVLAEEIKAVRETGVGSEGLKPSDIIPPSKKSGGRPKLTEEEKQERKEQRIEAVEEKRSFTKTGKLPERELTAADKRLLKRLEKGDVDLDEMSRILSSRVFEKILKNPSDVKFIDLFRANILKLKQDENRVKEDYAKQIVARLFAGQLPPENCPKCGVNIVQRAAFDRKREDDELKVLEGETVNAN